MAINDTSITSNHIYPLCTTLQDASAIVKKNLFFDRESADLSDQLNVTSMCKLCYCFVI